MFCTVAVLVDAPYWVLGTDYDNYAVIWSCSNFGIFSTRKFPSNRTNQWDHSAALNTKHVNPIEMIILFLPQIEPVGTGTTLRWSFRIQQIVFLLMSHELSIQSWFVSVALVLKDRLKINFFRRMYRVIQWEKLISWQARLSDIVGKKVYIKVRLILNVCPDRRVWIYILVCGVGWRAKVHTRDELLPRIFYVAASIQKSEDRLKWTTRDLRKRVAKFYEIIGGSFEHLFWTVPNLSFKH